MSIVTTPRYRRPKLKVFGPEPSPRHEVAFVFYDDCYYIVRFWTEAEFAAIPGYARPEEDAASWLPGVGWFALKSTGEDEHNRVNARVREAQAAHALAGGIGS